MSQPAVSVADLLRQLQAEVDVGGSLVATPSPKRRRRDVRRSKRSVTPSVASCTFPEGSTCCKGMQCHAKYSVASVQAIRRHFKSLDATDKRAFIKQRLLESERVDNSIHRKYHLDLSPLTLDKPMVAPEQRPRCCIRWFTFVLAISGNMIYQPHLPERFFQVKLTGRTNTAPVKANAVVMWLKELSRWACLEPDNDVYALPFARWSDVYELYCEERQAYDYPKVSKQYFREVRRTDARVKNIVLRKYLRFAKCDDCVEFRRLRNATRDEQELTRISREERSHKVFVRQERGSFWTRRARGRMRPNEYVSVILDGADQSGFGTPYLREKDHRTQAAHNIPVKLMGAIVHGLGSWVFTHLDHVRAGSNATLDCLVRVLQQVHHARGGNLAPKLYLQLDNTCKQNKNKYVMSFLALLVEHGVFREIVVSFLPVGHTHEDIDQMFSRFAIALRKADFLSRHGMGEVLARSYHNKAGEPVKVAHLDRFTNFSDWIKPHIDDAAFKGISQYRQFLIARTGGGAAEQQTVIRVRKACASREYKTWTAIVPPGHRTLPWRKDMGAPPLDLKDVPPAQRKAQDEVDKNAVHRSTKVKKVEQGVRSLIKAKQISGFHQKSLEADLELMRSSAPLPNDLPHGHNALKILLREGAWGSADPEDALAELDDGSIYMMSDYELKVEMNVAVLVDAEETMDVYKRWDFAFVHSIDKDRRCPGDEVGCIVQVRYYTPHGKFQGKPKYRLVAKGRYKSPLVWIHPEAIQMQVEFTQNMIVTSKCVKELRVFLEQADHNPDAADDDPDADWCDKDEEDIYW